MIGSPHLRLTYLVPPLHLIVYILHLDGPSDEEIFNYVNVQTDNRLNQMFEIQSLHPSSH